VDLGRRDQAKPREPSPWFVNWGADDRRAKREESAGETIDGWDKPPTWHKKREIAERSEQADWSVDEESAGETIDGWDKPPTWHKKREIADRSDQAKPREPSPWFVDWDDNAHRAKREESVGETIHSCVPCPDHGQVDSTTIKADDVLFPQEWA
jgi:hypothetical protein